MKPNRLELAFATGMAVGSIAEALKAAEALQQTVQAEFLSISLDKGGMLYFKNAQDFHLFPAEVKEVFDVSGAGDVVTALLAMTMAHQMPINSIFSLANLAACIEISKLGATSVSLAEMLNELTPMHLRKVIAKDALAELRNRSEEDWILTFGYFDDLKPGHLKFIQAMASLNGVRVVAINSDRSIEKNKGQKPLLSEEERASLLASFSHIDWVVIFDEPNASYLVEVLRPNILVKGEAHKGKPLPEQKAVEAVGAKLVYLPRF